eukprot:scaffold1535_cov382-Prasinococcus_capsulatus_cf.AAC.32
MCGSRGGSHLIVLVCTAVGCGLRGRVEGWNVHKAVDVHSGGRHCAGRLRPFRRGRGGENAAPVGKAHSLASTLRGRHCAACVLGVVTSGAHPTRGLLFRKSRHVHSRRCIIQLARLHAGEKLMRRACSGHFIKRLGQGNFGVARLYKHNATGDRVAAKFLERGEKIDENVMREILNHKQLQHTHIVQFRYCPALSSVPNRLGGTADGNASGHLDGIRRRRGALPARVRCGQFH